jgi:1-acyl-sn-glycerol-3-phosphate acyltransferase
MSDPAPPLPAAVPDRMAGLTHAERFNVGAIEAWHANRVLSRISVFLGYHVSRPAIKAVVGNLVRTHHFERLREVPIENGILLCGNHRSYLDPFAISALAWDHLPPNVRFVVPSRTEGLYDRWWSLVANLAMTFGNIYPPVVRGSRGGAWGKQVTQILTDLLNSGPMVVPIHPEGGRSKGPDPYSLLRGRPGLGKIIHQTRAAVFPIFQLGFPRGPRAVLAANYRRGARANPLVHAVMGPPVDFSAERTQPGSPALYYDISQKLVAAIAALIPEERSLKGLPPLPQAAPGAGGASALPSPADGEASTAG